MTEQQLPERPTLDKLVLAHAEYSGPLWPEIGYYDITGRTSTDKRSYRNEARVHIAVTLMGNFDGYPEVLLTLSSNLGPHKRPGHLSIWVKDYSENEGVLDELVQAGWLEKTGRTSTSGWVTLEEAKLAGPLLDYAAAVEAQFIEQHEKAQQ